MEDIGAGASIKEYMVMVAKYHESANELFREPCLIADTADSVMAFDPRPRGQLANGVVRRHATAANWDGEREGRWRLLYSAMLVTGSSIVLWTLIIAGVRGFIS